MFAALSAARNAMAAVAGVKTCKIGMEATITPADYPMVRIVPGTVRDAAVIGRRSAECTVYAGMPILEFEGGLEALYSALFGLEAALLTALRTAPGIIVRHIETVLDEDEVADYKLMALRVEVEG